MSRTVNFDSVHNFRDFGGYAAGAHRVKTGLLYRSAHHARASDADLAALQAMKLATIVDLRRPNERRRDPARRWPEFSATVIENDLGDMPDGVTDPYHQFLRSSDLSLAAIHRWNLDYYRDAPFEPRHVDLFARYFQTLAHGSGPVLIHCAIGRDRTGILVALTQHLLGVHDDDILAEYMLTNANSHIEERTPDLIAFVTRMSGRTPSHETIDALTHIEPELLATAFAAIEARYGSLDAYLSDALGIDAQTRASIEQFVLSEA